MSFIVFIHSGIEIFDQETELTEELLKKQNVMPQIVPSKFNL